MSEIAIMPLGVFGRIGDLLSLLRGVRNLPELDTPEGLKAAFELVVQVGDMLGLDPDFLERIRQALDDEELLGVLAAIARYVLGLMSGSEQVATVQDLNTGDSVTVLVDRDNEKVVTNQSIATWLPLILQVIGLVRHIRDSFGQGKAPVPHMQQTT
jgi:hypothetical protein